ncbi:hypothetical protein [Tengunoibacter tsumagoiensis]|uniref:Uncharacterized protein n=1 Tax=Tengunoibacter tsumagoiensis TaxID=2014871 RepID=A0A402A920_9CHLR|nr:hypothetical protein [Tengunoibacter tsumagoiensis]GCE15643.1 hypothetical protein KTT_55020 [Tengunoibacter tsumagoiensis]
MRQHLSTSKFREVLDIIEVRSWLVQWPGYLKYASSQQLLQVVDRIDYLVDRLEQILLPMDQS